MKRLAFVVVAAALVVAAVAYALPDADPWVSVNERKDFIHPVRFNREVYSNYSLAANFIDAGSIRVNGLTFGPSGRGTLVYDFPSLSGPNTAINTSCAESSAGTATGCAFGDAVVLGIDQAPVNAFGTITAYVSAADSFKVRACASGITDGGTFNMPDASYTVTCVR